MSLSENNTPDRPILIYFAGYSDYYKTSASKTTLAILVALMLFAMLGLTWAIPFPYLKFLGKYNGFFNWASFFIAICVYCYYKLSPVLSYLILIILFAFSYGVMQLAVWQSSGGPALWVVCLVILALSFIIQFAQFKATNKDGSFIDDLKFLLIAPVWLLHFLLKRFSIRYQ